MPACPQKPIPLFTTNASSRRPGGTRVMISSRSTFFRLRGVRSHPCEKPLIAQPGSTSRRPRGAGMLARTHTEIVGGSRIDMQLRGNARSPQREIHQHAVLGGTDDVVSAVREEDG